MSLDVDRLEPAYRRFRAQLRAATAIDEPDYRAWVSQRVEVLSQSFTCSKADDAAVWLREQYIRSTRGVL